MAKKNGKSAELLSPLYASGRTNGEVAGMKGGKSPSDPLGYRTETGSAAPGGSPADRKASSYGPAATAH